MTNIYQVVAVVSVLFLSGARNAVPSDGSTVLSTLDKNHPRLMLKDEDLRKLKELHTKDKILQKCVGDVLKQADNYCESPTLKHEKIGPRLLHVSRECLNRVYALGLAYRWTGEEKYAKKTLDNLLTVCDFNDWNPSHFLDTAEMSHAVGIGYDWLYSYMNADTRQKIKAGLIKHGLEPGLRVYKGQGWWSKSEFNWNQVCNGGLLVGALAIAESDPSYAQQIIPAALESLPLALKSYDPDGAWMEGPGYWSYATHYTAYGLAALQTALGNDFGLSQRQGLSKAGDFLIYATGPTRLYLNYADSGERSSRSPLPCMFWLARTFNNPLYAASEHAELLNRPADPEHVIWYVPADEHKVSPKELDRYFRGEVELAVFRSAWDDPSALFVGVKAGYNQVNHGHLDLGNFELDALGTRWARDLGSDNYDLPGYWDSKRGGKRWTYYRLNSASHNVPLLGGEDQDPMATAKFMKVQINSDSPYVIIDLTSAYEKFSKKTTRGVGIVSDRRVVLVQDEFEIEKPCEVVWGMTTDADIKVEEPATVRLGLRGKTLTAHLLSPAGATFTVESAERAKPEKTNAGVKRLVVRLPQASGKIQVAVLLAPVWKDGQAAPRIDLKSLQQW